MAYQFATGIARNTDDFLVKLRDFVVTTCGWTSLQDTVTTGVNGQYFAVRSIGEAGTERCVLRFFRTTANTISLLGYLNWAAGVGTAAIGSTSGTAGTGTFILTDDDDEFQYWMFGSLDRIIIFTKTTARAAMSSVYGGLYTRARSATVSTTTNAPTAGTSVVITMASTAAFTVNRYYTIADDSGFEWFQVTAINPGVSITAARLEGSYAIGARVGEDPRPCLITADTQVLGIFNANHYLQAPPWRRAPMNQGFVRVAPVDSGYEQVGLDAAIGAKAVLFPLVIYDESALAGAYVGQLVEAFTVAQDGVANDDTITVGGATYHVIVTAGPFTPPSTLATAWATVATRIALAIRRA